MSFPKIAAINPDGVVFNCRGPQESIAFVPHMLVMVLEHIDDPQSDAPPTYAGKDVKVWAQTLPVTNLLHNCTWCAYHRGAGVACVEHV